MSIQVSKQDLINEMWRRGSVSLIKLDPAQKDIDERVKASKEKIQVVLCGRRLGKSYWALVHAIETCLKKPNIIVKFLAPTKTQIDEIIEQIMPLVINDCPDELRPTQLKSKFTYKFHNGSKLQLAGNNNGHVEKLRGGFAHLCIVDEARDCDGLQNSVRSVLIPTTANTKGKIILLSTPPQDPEHDFIKFIEDADTKGTLIKKMTEENPRITQEEMQGMIDAYPGGVKNPEFRREFRCEILKNFEYSAVPEFTEDLEKEIVLDWKKPAYYDCYEAMDLGFKDLTVVLFGYYDFKNAKLIVEDELVMNFQENENNLFKLVKEIQRKEGLNFTDPMTNEIKSPSMRTSDINYIVMKEINNWSSGLINFLPIKKDDKQAMVNSLRIMIQNKKIIINPRCKTLIAHLRNVKWSKSNKSIFERNTEQSHHYDAVDALCYLIRVVEYNRNPYPAFYDRSQQDLIILNKPRGYNSQDGDIVKKMLNFKRKN